jgi:hypothetical protein
MPIDAGGAAWEAWLRSAAPAEASRIRQALDRQLAGIGGAPGSRLAVIAWRPDAASDGVPGENLAARVAEAWRCGVETADEDLRYLYALEVRTWAPTSERSRAQAGFGKY